MPPWLAGAVTYSTLSKRLAGEAFPMAMLWCCNRSEKLSSLLLSDDHYTLLQ